MIISVTKLIALSGHNPYYQAIDAFYALRRRNSYNFKIRQVLLKHPIAERFTNVAKITPKLKQDARQIVNKLCKKHNIKHGRPYGFFARHRGRVLERFTIRGKADCLLNGETVIEIKCRMYRFMKAKPFELDQLALYCTSLRKDGLLIQYFDKQLHVTKLSLEEAEKRAHKILDDAEWLFGNIRRREGFPPSSTSFCRNFLKSYSTLPKRLGVSGQRYSSRLAPKL